MTLTRRRYLLFIVYNIKGEILFQIQFLETISRGKREGEKFQRKEFSPVTRNIGLYASPIYASLLTKRLKSDAFSYDVSFIRLEICLRGKGRGRANVTYAENRIVDRLRSIYFQYSFSVNGSRRHNVFAEYKTFGKSTVISRKPDSMLSLPLSLFSSSRHTRTRVVLLRFEN